MNKKPQPSYEALGVSHQKEDVHAALKNADKGLFPQAFCKIQKDLAGDPLYCSTIHADGAGTKSTLAYMMYSETGKLDYFRGIVQDSVVMNSDDVLCIGKPENMLLSNTIGRNKKLISADIISVVINSYADFINKLQSFGAPIISGGGETADVGDLVRTMIVDSTLVSRMKRDDVINPENIQPGDVIVGLSSYGKASYEDLPYNSGIGSNGLTLARHGVLNHQYYDKYPECFSPELDEKWVFFGDHALEEPLTGTPLTVGEAILSPTRTYLPIFMELFKSSYTDLHAIYHNTGGGQSKCLKFGNKIHYIKDDMLEIPPFFSLIQKSSNTPWREMYQVFNMGHRLEFVCSEEFANEHIIPISQKFGVEARIVGHVEKSTDTTNHLTLTSPNGEFHY